MNSSTAQPKFEKILRYTSAYVWFLFFILFGLAITWCLRSDIFLLCIALHIPDWITYIINTWGTFAVFIPFVLLLAGLEPYMNTAAQKNIVRKRALKVLTIEGSTGLVILIVMGILFLSGYPPTF
jgi:hypothetical protein